MLRCDETSWLNHIDVTAGKSSKELKKVTSPFMRFVKENLNKLNMIWCSKHKKAQKGNKREKEREEKCQRVVPRCTRPAFSSCSSSWVASEDLCSAFFQEILQMGRQGVEVWVAARMFKHCPLLVQRCNHMLIFESFKLFAQVIQLNVYI